METISSKLILIWKFPQRFYLPLLLSWNILRWIALSIQPFLYRYSACPKDFKYVRLSWEPRTESNKHKRCDSGLLTRYIVNVKLPLETLKDVKTVQLFFSANILIWEFSFFKFSFEFSKPVHVSIYAPSTHPIFFNAFATTWKYFTADKPFLLGLYTLLNMNKLRWLGHVCRMPTERSARCTRFSEAGNNKQMSRDRRLMPRQKSWKL